MVDYNYDPSTDTNLVDTTIENLASTKSTIITSSSEKTGGEAINAVNGDIDGSFYRGGCFSSGVQQGSHWWRATFDGVKEIGKVIIYPRLDLSSDDDYLGGAEVSSFYQEPTETSIQPIRTRYLGHLTVYQPIRDRIRSVPSFHHIGFDIVAVAMGVNPFRGPRPTRVISIKCLYVLFDVLKIQ
eukprot:sb/3471493/